MASHLSMSLSDSVQVSLILQHQEERKEQQSLRGKSINLDRVPLTKEGSETSIPLYQQCLLVMVFAGIEMCVTFTAIFSILFLQFMGVPTSLVSVEGIIGGGISIICIPITGYFSDKGPDLVIRKLGLTFISLTMFVLGFCGLAICCVARLNIDDLDIWNTTHVQNMTHPPNVHHQTDQNITTTTATLTSYRYNVDMTENNFNSTSIFIPHNDTISTTSGKQLDGVLEYSIGVIQVIGILSTGFLDAGFDIGMTLCRAFILEVSPPIIHTKLLIMATAFSAIGGLVMSSVGIIDFPNILGPAFGVDGTAATVLMFSCSVLTVTITGFACSLLTGYMISRKNKTLHTEKDDKKSINVQQSGTVVNGEDDNGENPTKPLISANSIDNKSYSSFVTNSVGELEKKLDNLSHEINSSSLSTKPSFEYTDGRGNAINDDEEDADDDEESIDGNEDDRAKTNIAENYNSIEEVLPEREQESESEISNTHASLRTSYSMSLSVVQSNLLGDVHAQKYTPDVGLTPSKDASMWRCKRLWFLLLAIFCTTGANITFNEFNGNTVNIGVYHGDPSSLPGTKERDYYNLGLRSSALGNVIMYSSFCIICLLNKKIIDVIGEKSYFASCQGIYTAALCVFILTKMSEIYFTLCVVSGFYRGCAYTLAYIMVNKLVKEETSKQGGQPSKNIGTIMAMVGFLLPSVYMLSSTMVGPLMAALNSVWVPMAMAAVGSGLSLCAFCFYLFAKG